LKEAGFQVRDSTQADLLEHLLERCGGHFVDIGTGIELLSTGKVGIKSGVTPISYMENGLNLSDGSKLVCDAVIWCTGFSSVDIRPSITGILGAGSEALAASMDATWGIDAEGEVRGLWKRQTNVKNLYVISGGGAQHRWFSKVVGLQLKGALKGILPDAYREI
jgi:hypothetical protein